MKIRTLTQALLFVGFSLNAAHSEPAGGGVQIGSSTNQPRMEERKRIWPSTEELLDLHLDEFKTEWRSGFVEYFTLCKEVLNRPCSFEATDTEDIWTSTSAPKIHLTNTTPRKVLDAMVAPYPKYRWVVRNDVINLEPVSRTKNDPLARKLKTFSIHGESSFRAALEVLKQAKLKFAYQSTNGIAHGTFARIDIELKDVTVREALNAIARTDGQMMWQYHPPLRIWNSKRDGTVFFPSYRKNGLNEHESGFKFE